MYCTTKPPRGNSTLVFAQSSSRQRLLFYQIWADLRCGRGRGSRGDKARQFCSSESAVQTLHVHETDQSGKDPSGRIIYATRSEGEAYRLSRQAKMNTHSEMVALRRWQGRKGSSPITYHGKGLGSAGPGVDTN